MRLTLALLAAVFAGATSAEAGVPAPARYTVQMQLIADGKVIGTPTVIARIGDPVAITVDQPGGYSMRVTLFEGRRANTLRLGTEIRLKRDGQWTLAGTPTIETAIGRDAAIEIRQPEGSGVSVIRLESRLAPTAL